MVAVHMLCFAMLCYAMLLLACLLACLLAAAVVCVSTDSLQEHNVTGVPRGTSVTQWLRSICYAMLCYVMLRYAERLSRNVPVYVPKPRNLSAKRNIYTPTTL